MRKNYENLIKYFKQILILTCAGSPATETIANMAATRAIYSPNLAVPTAILVLNISLKSLQKSCYLPLPVTILKENPSNIRYFIRGVLHVPNKERGSGDAGGIGDVGGKQV